MTELTKKFVAGLPGKYRDRVEDVVKEDFYLVYLTWGWLQSDDEVTTVVGDTMAEARRAVKESRRGWLHE